MTTISLSSCPKTYAADQDKAVHPEETLKRVKRRLASLDLNILAETRRVDTGRLGIPVFLSVCGADAKAVMPTRKQMGKGASAVQAETSALMELMERYGFFSFWEKKPGGERMAWKEAEARFGTDLMPAEEIIAACHDSVSPEAARTVLNLREWLFFPALRLGKTPEKTRTVYVPLDLFKSLGEFNGSSAGNTDVESILQGACELVERHVCCRADREAPELPAIDATPENTKDPVLAELLKKFRDNGVVLLLKDFSMGMPVPTVAAIAYDPATFPETSEIVYTAGTAASPAKAAIRAVTEVAQLAGDFHSRACYEASGLPKFSDLSELTPLLQGPSVPLESLPSVEAEDILDELRALAGGLEALGFPLYTVSTTNPDTQVPSNYSFAPGFQFRERDKNASLGLFVGRLICEEEDAETALAGLAVLEKIYPNAHFVPFFQGMLAMRAENFEAARAFFAKAEPMQPDADAKALCAFYHGYCHTLEDDFEAAFPGIDRAATLCPEMKEYINMRGVCRFKAKDFEAAAEDFKDIITRLDKGSAVDLQNLGVCRKMLGRHEEAREYLEAALVLDPTLEGARRHLAEL